MLFVPDINFPLLTALAYFLEFSGTLYTSWKQSSDLCFLISYQISTLILEAEAVEGSGGIWRWSANVLPELFPSQISKS